EALELEVVSTNDDKDLGGTKNGGGGGSRTRVRKCVHSGVYVHSPSIRIRRPGPRRTRCLGSLGGFSYARFRSPAEAGSRVPLSSPSPPSGRRREDGCF